MIQATLPRLTSLGQDLDTSPEAFGELESSLDIQDDAAALRESIAENGYLFLPGYLDRDEVLAARRATLEKISEAGLLDPAYDIDEAICAPHRKFSFMPELAKDNPALMKVLYSGRMMEFYDLFLGGKARHFDYTWMRAVAPGKGTPPHCDIVYMGRGTKNLYTSWTPLGDIPIEIGGLIVLEGSNRIERLKANYGSKDVDSFCSNRRGDDHVEMGGGGNITSGGWLSKNPPKLRERLGGRWLTANYRAGDLLIITMYTVHSSIDNGADCIRLSSDTRYQLASDPVDERWIGEDPIAHGPAGKRGMIC